MSKNKYIEWIGTGSAFNPPLGNTSFTVKGDDERIILIDCGTAVPAKLFESNEMVNVTDIVLTHTHADHVGGLEYLGAMKYFAFKQRDDERANLYVATRDFADKLWNNSVRGGLGKILDDDGHPMDATLETFFKVKVGKDIDIPNLLNVKLFETQHVKGMECYGMILDGKIFYSGDTIELPPSDAEIIFQDCQFYDAGPANVHIPYSKLKKELPLDVRKKTHLVHLSGGYDKINPKEDGFAGFVMPKQKFDL